MSVLVAFANGQPSRSREADQRRRLRSRALAVAGTLLLMVGMAAVPAPVWRASEDLATRGEQLRRWIDEAHAAEREASAFRAAGGEEQAAAIEAGLDRWLRPHDPIETRNELLRIARASGLSVLDVHLGHEERPLAPDIEPRDLTVLGAAVAAPPAAPPRVPGQPLDLVADRYTVTGTGALPAVVLFCGVVRALPVPLRLSSVRLDAAPEGQRFSVVLDKFLARPGNAPAETPHADA
jgi:hypothetical protein